MATKEERAAEAKKHVGLARGVFGSDIRASVDSAKVYEDGEGRELELPEPRYEQTEVRVAWGPLAHAIARAGESACVVSPASYRAPAGNYLAGGWSPECQICAESTLFPVLEGLKGSFYAGNAQSQRGGLYSDRAAYLTGIVFTTGGVVRRRDVLAIAPPNRRFALENHRSEAECAQDLANRVEALLRIAATNQPDVLILDAFGCGFNDNDPLSVVELFKAWFAAHPGQFEKVVFAISGGPALDVFRAAFPEEQEAPVVEGVVEGEPEAAPDDETTDVAPTSDGRWVFD